MKNYEENAPGLGGARPLDRFSSVETAQRSEDFTFND